MHVVDQVPNFAKYHLSSGKEHLSSEKEEEIREATEKAMAERIGDEKDAEAVLP